ncbi:hypothetical protein MTO96_024452 [Rhipicephalus appendiculatus]
MVHIAVEKGRTNFFRDLDGEALLRQFHLRQRPSFGHATWGEPLSAGLWLSLVTKGITLRQDVGVFEENIFDGSYACPSTDAMFF